jgi:hypothetical protein
MKDETLEVFWQNVVDRWDDDAAHKAFLLHCQNSEQLGVAAARYAAMKNDAARGPSAQKRLEAIAVLATAALQASREPIQAVRQRWLWAVTVLVFGTMAAYAVVRVALL